MAVMPLLHVAGPNIFFCGFLTRLAPSELFVLLLGSLVYEGKKEL